MSKAEGGKKTEDRGRKTEDRGQRTEDGKTEGRGTKKTEDRRQRTEKTEGRKKPRLAYNANIINGLRAKTKDKKHTGAVTQRKSKEKPKGMME